VFISYRLWDRHITNRLSVSGVGSITQTSLGRFPAATSGTVEVPATAAPHLNFPAISLDASSLLVFEIIFAFGCIEAEVVRAKP
jgi:hypothetical protein